MATITSANAALIIAVATVIPVPAPIEGFAADDAFATEAVATGEVRMGVDGILSGGYTPYPVPLDFTLQPDSPSVLVMDTWRQAQDAVKDLFIASAEVRMPSIGKTFLFTRGFLVTTVTMPNAKKILDPQHYRVMFQKCNAVPLA